MSLTSTIHYYYYYFLVALLVVTLQLKDVQANRWVSVDCPSEHLCPNSGDCFTAVDCPENEMEADPNWEHDEERGCWIEQGPAIDQEQLFPNVICSKHRPYRVVGKMNKEHIGTFEERTHAQPTTWMLEILYSILFCAFILGCTIVYSFK